MPFLLSGCASHSDPTIHFIGPQSMAEQSLDESKASGGGITLLKQTPHTSVYFARLKGSEQLHLHQKHDQVVFLLRGNVRVHTDVETLEMGASDSLFIESGSWHLAENLGPGMAEAIVVFTPSYDGKDKILKGEKKST